MMVMTVMTVLVYQMEQPGIVTVAVYQKVTPVMTVMIVLEIQTAQL